MIKQSLILLTLISVSVGTVEAKMYRWTDENGVTVYSQAPPPSGKAKEIKPLPSPKKEAEADKVEPEIAEDNANNTNNDLAAEDTSEEKPSKEEIAASNKIKQENCTAVKHNLQLYENLGQRVVKSKSGLYKRPTEEERQAEIAKNKELMKEYCN